MHQVCNAKLYKYETPKKINKKEDNEKSLRYKSLYIFFIGAQDLSVILIAIAQQRLTPDCSPENRTLKILLRQEYVLIT